MATLNQFGNAEFTNNLILNSLDMPDKSALVYDYSSGFNVIDFMITRKAASKQTAGLNGEFQKPIMGRSHVTQPILSNAAVGTNLQVNWVDTTFDMFRTGFILNDGSAGNYQGKVVSHTPGSVVLEPAGNLTAWNTALHFTTNRTAVETFNASPIRGSRNVEYRYEYPTYVLNRTSTSRENVPLFYADLAQTWVKYKGDFWWSLQDELMLSRFARALEMKAIFSQYGVVNSFDGVTNYSMGLKSAIQDPQRGGVYQPMSSAPTVADVEGWLEKIANKKTGGKTKIQLGVGRGFLKLVQAFPKITNSIIYSGTRNTFGGDTVKGVDVYMMAWGGIEIEMFLVPAFNDNELFPQLSTIYVPDAPGFTRMAYTAVAMDFDDYPAIGGGTVPAMEKVYFGSREMHYFYTPGVAMGTSLQGSSTPEFTGGNPYLAVTDSDSVTWGCYSNCAYDYMALRMGWFELTN